MNPFSEIEVTPLYSRDGMRSQWIRTDRDKVGLPWNWAEVWSLCNAIIDSIRSSRKFNLVVTARMKEEYINDRATGKLIPQIYSTLPYKSDIILQLEEGHEISLKKNGFSGDVSVKIPSNQTLPQIYSASFG